MLQGARAQILGSLVAVALAAGCAPGASGAAPATGAPPAANTLTLPAAGQPLEDGLTLGLAKAAPAATFVALPDPEGGPRSRARVTALPNGAALVTGGLTASGATSQVLYYDPLAGSFTTLKGAALADPRYDHEATLLPQGDAAHAAVLVTGGLDDRGPLASVELVLIDLSNPASSRTLELSPLPEARSEHRAVLVPLGSKGGKAWSGAFGVLVVGGCVPQPGRASVPASSSLLYRLDVGEDGRVREGRAVQTASQPRVARFAHQALLLPGASKTLGSDDGRVLVLGGYGIDQDAVTEGSTIGPLAAAEVYEPATDRWSKVHFEGAGPAPRFEHRMARAEGTALLVGGEAGGGAGPRAVETIDLDPRDATLGRLGAGALLARSRAAPEVATLDDGRILVAGGFDPPSGAARDDAEVLSSNGRSVEPPFSIGSGRFEHGLVSLGPSRALIFGGRASREIFGSPASGLLLLKK